MRTKRRWLAAAAAFGCGLTGCQTWIGGMTLPSPRYLEHYPQYFAPDPSFPLPRELATQTEQGLAGGRRPAAVACRGRPMAHGWRGRAAGIGAALAVCTGLGGCMHDDKKAYTPPPAAKGMTASPPASTRTGAPPAGGPSAQWGQPGTQTPRTPPSSGFASPGGSSSAPNPHNTGSINTPAVPGNYGSVAPVAGTAPLAPSVGPAGGTSVGSHYTPAARAPELPPGSAGDVMPPLPPPTYGSGQLPAVGPAADSFPAVPTPSGGPLPPIGGSPPYSPR